MVGGADHQTNTKKDSRSELSHHRLSRCAISAATAGTRYSVASPPSYSLLPSTEGLYLHPHPQTDYDTAIKTSATLKSPPDSVPSGKLKLLLVYINGFMGNETSFQSFLAHLHNLLSITLEDLGWSVDTKVVSKVQQ